MYILILTFLMLEISFPAEAYTHSRLIPFFRFPPPPGTQSLSDKQ